MPARTRHEIAMRMDRVVFVMFYEMTSPSSFQQVDIHIKTDPILFTTRPQCILGPNQEGEHWCASVSYTYI